MRCCGKEQVKVKHGSVILFKGQAPTGAVVSGLFGLCVYHMEGCPRYTRTREHNLTCSSVSAVTELRSGPPGFDSRQGQ